MLLYAKKLEKDQSKGKEQNNNGHNYIDQKYTKSYCVGLMKSAVELPMGTERTSKTCFVKHVYRLIATIYYVNVKKFKSMTNIEQIVEMFSTLTSHTGNKTEFLSIAKHVSENMLPPKNLSWEKILFQNLDMRSINIY